jgi:hypothetical protein
MSKVIVPVAPDTEAVIPEPTKSNIVTSPLVMPSSLIVIALKVPAPAEVTVPQDQVPSPFAIGT